MAWSNDPSSVTEVSEAALPVIWVPLVCLPLPQVESKGSVDCCAPYTETLNPHANGCVDGELFDTQPIAGTVTTGFVPWVRSAAMNESSDVLSTMFSK